MSVQRVLILLWKYLLVKEEELFYWWKVSKFLLAALFANARRVDVSKFRVENTAILRLRPRKLIFLLFSQIKAFLREQLTSDYLSTSKSIFQLLPLNGRYFLTVALISSTVMATIVHEPLFCMLAPWVRTGEFFFLVVLRKFISNIANYNV